MPAPTVSMVAPATFAGIVTTTPSGTTYQPDAQGFVRVFYQDIATLASQGFQITALRNNFTLTSDPAAGNDSTQDYTPGSRAMNTTSGRMWTNVSNAPGAAVWTPEDNLLGELLGANFNVTTDQAIPLFLPASAHYRISKITVTNASVSLTTAAGGFYDAAAKGGNALVAAGQAYAALTAAKNCLDITPALNLREGPNGLLFLSLSTAQGAAATADVYVFGDLFSQ